MSETTMPAAEAMDGVDASERTHYELAFHVLPTVAEGEVATVFDAIKNEITNAGGELGLEEKPDRFELAYEITKHIDGKHRRFTTAYFGWVRFTAAAANVPAMMTEIESHSDVLRAMLVKLTKAEDAHPFYFHEALNADQKISEAELDDEEDTVVEENGDNATEAETAETAAPAEAEVEKKSDEDA